VYSNADGNYSGCSAGAGCISVDPLFADAGNDDYHLKSWYGRWDGNAWVQDAVHSPCIDAGTGDYSNEPGPNGDAANIGRWGNTDEASKSRPATDALIRNSGEPAYIGDNIYNNDGTNQTKAQPVATSETAVYDIELQNDGTAADYFVVPGTAGGSGWTVRYKRINNHGAVTDITARVIGAGWRCLMTVGLSRELWVEVTESGAGFGGAGKQVLVTVTSDNDATHNDTVKAVTTHVTPLRPDALIRNDADPDYIGDGIYNTDGTDQTKSQTVNHSQTAKYWVELQNDGTDKDRFTVTGTAGGAGWTVRYLRNNIHGGVSDITARVTGAGWSCLMTSGLSRELWVEVTPDDTVPGDEVKQVLVTATSESNPSLSDTVKASTTCDTGCRPDALICTAAEHPAYIGDDIYNSDGTGQTKSQTALTSATAKYWVELQNDGWATDRFTVTGTTGGSG